MQKLPRLLLGPAFAAIAACCIPIAVPAGAQAAVTAGPCHVSLYGTVTSVSSDRFTLQTTARTVDVHARGAKITERGSSLRSGAFAGVYGCYGATENEFNASQVTVSASQAAYYGRGGADSDDTASGADIDACHVSIFGTIASLRGSNGFMLQTQRGSLGTVFVDHRDARLNSNGLSVRPGVFAGVYGCVERDGQILKANEVTVAPSAAAYTASNHTVSLTGTVDEVHSGWIGVQSRYTGHIHVYTSQTGIRTGERVQVRGPYDPMTGVVRAASVTAI